MHNRTLYRLLVTPGSAFCISIDKQNYSLFLDIPAGTFPCRTPVFTTDTEARKMSQLLIENTLSKELSMVRWSNIHCLTLFISFCFSQPNLKAAILSFHQNVNYTFLHILTLSKCQLSIFNNSPCLIVMNMGKHGGPWVASPIRTKY